MAKARKTTPPPEETTAPEETTPLTEYDEAETPAVAEGEDTRHRCAMVRKALQRLGVPESKWDDAVESLGAIDLESLTGRAAVVKYAESIGVATEG